MCLGLSDIGKVSKAQARLMSQLYTGTAFAAMPQAGRVYCVPKYKAALHSGWNKLRQHAFTCTSLTS